MTFPLGCGKCGFQMSAFCPVKPDPQSKTCLKHTGRTEEWNPEVCKLCIPSDHKTTVALPLWHWAS